MRIEVSSEVQELIDRLFGAWNAHYLEAFLACFDPSYDSRWPIHPDRDFVGSDHVRQRWSGNFARMPDFKAERLGLAFAVDGSVWVETRWTGTPSAGPRFDQQGVIVYGVREGRIVSGRLYLEPTPDPNGRPES
jgi:ketosteroid isomerase-like protein